MSFHPAELSVFFHVCWFHEIGQATPQHHCLSLLDCWEETPRPRQLLLKRAFNQGASLQFQRANWLSSGWEARQRARQAGCWESSWELRSNPQAGWGRQRRLGSVWVFEFTKPILRGTFPPTSRTFQIGPQSSNYLSPWGSLLFRPQ